MHTQISRRFNSGALFDKTEDINEDECFECGKGGRLSCCDFCPKAFHSACRQVKNKNNLWTCYYCSQQRCCQFCDQTTKDAQSSLCTICRIASHKQCITQYLNVPLSQKEQTLLKDYTFVCRGCLKKYGICQIKKCMRSGKFVNLVFEEQLFALVRINYKSPVHFGFFKEKDIQQAFKIQIKERNNRRAKYQQKTWQLSKSLSVQKILQLKVPRQYEELDNYSLKQKLFRQEVEYGDKNNFQYLVKWEGIDYEGCTWEEQYTFKSLDLKSYHLKAFIKKLQNDQDLGNGLTLRETMKHYNYSWNEEVEQQRIMKMIKFTSIFGLNFIEGVSANSILVIRNVCYFLNHAYLIQGRKEASIIIVSKDQLQLWSNEIHSHCAQLSIVNFDGSSKGMATIKEKEIGKFKNQVVLTTCLHASKQQQFLQSKIKSLAFAIVDDFSFSRGRLNKYLKETAQSIIILEYSKWSKSEVLSMSEAYQQQYIVKHNAEWSLLEVLPQTPLDKNSKDVVKRVSIRQQKRLAIIRFMLKFGLPVLDIQQFYLALHKFQPLVFNLPTLTQQNALLFKDYITSLLTLLSLHHQMDINPIVIKHYFSNVDPARLLKRTIQLHRLRQFIKEESNIQLRDSEIKNKKGETLGIFTAWKRDDDLILANLVLEYGYDSWKQILSSRSWKKYSKLQKILQANRLSFIDYIKMKCAVQFKGAMGNLQQYMENRVVLMGDV